jgi:tripartite-type tricarboxylate transporter receptor subunit TctC
MKNIFRIALALLSVCLAVVPAVAADPYPSKTVTFLVPYPAGGLSDAIARSLSAPLTKALGQQVIVDNLGGVSGALAAQKVLNAPADGYLLFLGSPNEVILSPLANSAVKLRAEDFRLVSPLTINPLMVVARKDLPANTIDELVALGKRPGAEPLSYGSVGIGSMYHMLTESMAAKTGMAVTHVPYKGMAPLVQDMGGGNVDFAILPYATSFRGMANTGRMKLIGWVSETRSALDNEVPAFGEGKQLPSFSHRTWAGLMVKKGTPDEIVERIRKAIVVAMQDPEARKQLAATGSEIASTSSQADADNLLVSETAKFRAIAKSINLQPQ